MWLNQHVNDHYVKEAVKNGFRSRASFKLIEIQKKYKIIKKNNRIMDLGAAPGGWTQVAVEYSQNKKYSEKNIQQLKEEQEKKESANPEFKNVLAIDRLDMDPVPGAFFYKGDLLSEKTQLFIPEYFSMEPVDLILSDMAPNFSGDLDTDHYNIVQLNNICIHLAEKNLKSGGTLLMKTLQGADENRIFNQYKAYFKDFQRVKPGASRSKSSELYYLGRGFKLAKQYFIKKKFEEKVQAGLEENIKEEEMGLEEQALYKKTVTVLLESKIERGETLDQETINELKQIPFLKNFKDWDKLTSKHIKTREEQEKYELTQEPKSESQKYEEYKEDMNKIMGDDHYSFGKKRSIQNFSQFEEAFARHNQREKEMNEGIESKVQKAKHKKDKDEELFLSDDEFHPEDQNKKYESVDRELESVVDKSSYRFDYMKEKELEDEADRMIANDGIDGDIEKFLQSGGLEAIKQKALEIENLVIQEQEREKSFQENPNNDISLEEMIDEGSKHGYTKEQATMLYEEFCRMRDDEELRQSHSIDEFMSIRDRKGRSKDNMKRVEEFEKLFNKDQFQHQFHNFNKNN